MSKGTIRVGTAARDFCSVCHHPDLQLFTTVGHQIYRRCPLCQATMMDPAGWLSDREELAVYTLHDNGVEDAGYRRFLARLATPLVARLTPGQRGLDFGCGPGPALAAMLEEKGFSVARYDPAFLPDRALLEAQWDFITCTEVAEHLRCPLDVFALLDTLLKPGGLLGVMTCFQTDDDRFVNWHYRRDPTHIVFYREQTFRWLADHFGLELTIPRKDVVLLCKPRE